MSVRLKERHTDRETERQRDRETERQKDRQTDRQTGRQTGREKVQMDRREDVIMRCARVCQRGMRMQVNGSLCHEFVCVCVFPWGSSIFPRGLRDILGFHKAWISCACACAAHAS